jgi:hypothetical protein
VNSLINNARLRKDLSPAVRYALSDATDLLHGKQPRTFQIPFSSAMGPTVEFQNQPSDMQDQSLYPHTTNALLRYPGEC